jgi:hypothetical protein
MSSGRSVGIVRLQTKSHGICLHCFLAEEYKSQSFSLCSFFHPSVTSSLFGPNILLSTVLRHLQSMKNAAFWDVTPRGSCKNRRFGGT